MSDNRRPRLFGSALVKAKRIAKVSNFSGSNRSNSTVASNASGTSVVTGVSTITQSNVGENVVSTLPPPLPPSMEIVPQPNTPQIIPQNGGPTSSSEGSDLLGFSPQVSDHIRQRKAVLDAVMPKNDGPGLSRFTTQVIPQNGGPISSSEGSDLLGFSPQVSDYIRQRKAVLDAVIPKNDGPALSAFTTQVIPQNGGPISSSEGSDLLGFSPQVSDYIRQRKAVLDAVIPKNDGPALSAFTPQVIPQNGGTISSSEGSDLLGFSPQVSDYIRQRKAALDAVIPKNDGPDLSSGGSDLLGFSPQNNADGRKRKAVLDEVYGRDIPMSPISAKRPSVELSASFSGLTTADILLDSPVNDRTDDIVVHREPQPFFKIVLGSFCQMDAQFPSPHNQCTAMSATALAFHSIKSVVNWNAHDLDNILFNGQLYYNECMKEMRPDRFGITSADLAAVDLIENLKIGSKDIEVTLEFENGRNAPHVSRDDMVEAFTHFETRALSTILLSYGGKTYGVLRYRDISDDTDKFVFFDSHGRNGLGAKVVPDPFTGVAGKSAILFFHSANDLIHFFVTEYPLLPAANEYTEGQNLGLMPLTFTTSEDRLFRIVSGTFNEFHDNLPLQRQHKCCGIAIFSFVFSTLKLMFDWNASDIDTIIDKGSIFHQESYEENVPLHSYFHSQTMLTPRRMLINCKYSGFDYTVHLGENVYQGEINGQIIENRIRLLVDSSAQFGIFVINGLSYGLIVCQMEGDTQYVFIDSHGRTLRGATNGAFSAALYFDGIQKFVIFFENEFGNCREFHLYPVKLSRTIIAIENDIEMNDDTLPARFRKIICSRGIETDVNWGGHSHCIALSMCAILQAYANGSENWTENDLAAISTNGVLLHSISNEVAIENRTKLPLTLISDYIEHVERLPKLNIKMSLVTHTVGPPRSSIDFTVFEEAFKYFYYRSGYKFAILTINREQTYAISKCSDDSLLFYDCHGRTTEARHSGDLTVAIYFHSFTQFVAFLTNENEDMFIFSLEYITIENAKPTGSDLVTRAISGTFAQNDTRFGIRSRNTQCAANSVVFLAFASLIKDCWTRSDIDDVLMLGDQIYISSFTKALRRGPRKDTFLAAHEIDQNVTVDVNRFDRGGVNVHCGALTDKEYSGNFLNRGETLITRFFTNYNDGVLIGSNLAVALHKINDEYILFDPHACTVTGMHTCNGKANIFFFKDIPSLYKFLSLCGYKNSEFTLTPFTVYELQDTGRRRRTGSLVPQTAPINLDVSQAPSVRSIRSLPVRKSTPKIGDNRTAAERFRDKRRIQRQHDREKAIELNKPEYMQVLNKRWTNYLAKVRRTHSANVFGDKKNYIEFFNAHKGDATTNEAIQAALDAVEAFLDEEHHRQLSQMDKMKNNAMVPTHFEAFGNHDEIDESDEIYSLHLLSIMDQKCPHCGALYFKEECNTRKVFRTCCNFGEIHSELPEKLSLTYPPFLRDLLMRESPMSKEFLDNILLYNNVFSFASLGTTTMHHMQAVGTLGPVMAIEGKIYHMAEHYQTNSTGIGMPTAQLYYLDNEVAAVTERSKRVNVTLNYSLMLRLENILRNCNPLSETYKMLKSVLAEVRMRPNAANIKVHLEIVRNREHVKTRQNHGGDFGLVQSNEVAAVYTHLPSSKTKNIVVFPVNGPAESGIALTSTDPNRDAMLYPILFPHAEQTWTYNLMRRPRSEQTDSTVTIEDVDSSDDSEEEPEVDRFLVDIMSIDPPPFHVTNVRGGGAEEEIGDEDKSDSEEEMPSEEEDDDGAQRKKKRKRITVREFFCYLLMFRMAFSPILNAGKLGQQFIIDCYARAQDNTFEFLESEAGQAQIRSETYGALRDYVDRKKLFKADMPGKLIVMPDSIVGSRQYMKKRYSDALAMVAKFGKPTYFITMTCNPMWTEIQRKIPKNANAIDYPGIVARVFKAKIKELIDDIAKKHVLGRCLAYTGVVEWQKRSLPHFHVVVWISPEDRPENGVDIDNIVSAEIPDPTKQPRLYEAVTSYMSHHRCDQEEKYCRVPRKGKFKCPRHPKEGEQEDPDKEKACICFKCSKHFPRKFSNTSELVAGGYPTYRRRNDGRKFISGRGDEIDNRWIVPYNPYLLLKYNCHINIEITSSLKSIKYLFKYLHKGVDMARLKVTVIDGVQVYNEFEHFIDCRYLSAGESIWKLYGFPVFYRSHTIVRLPVHLPHYQNVIFRPNNIEYALDHAESPLTAYFHLNRTDPAAREYLYNEIPQRYVFDQKTKSWHKRQRRRSYTLARLYIVNYNNIELYSLRLLLLTIKGAESFEDLRTVSGTQYDTFAAAAAALGLLENDSMHLDTFKEIVNEEMPYRIRCMFVNMLKFYTPQNPIDIWRQFGRHMSEDYVKRGCSSTFATNLALRHISYMLRNIGKTNTDFGLPEPLFDEGELDDWLAQVRRNPEPTDTIDIAETTDQTTEQVEGERLSRLLNDDQRCIFDEITNSVLDPNAPTKLFFIDGPGGSGKTFLFSALINFILGLGKKVVAVAWTGIAASLLKGGRTAHSVFKLPFDFTGQVTCQLSLSSDLANQLYDADVIIWDEISMTPRHAIEAVDKWFRDLMGNNLPFGGKIFVTAGDFRQILPVLVNATKYELIDNIIKKSALWQLFTKFSLRTNVRLSDPNDIEFAQWLLDVGDGKIKDLPGNQYFDSFVKIPSECIESVSLVDRIYGKTFSSNDIDNYSKYAIVTTLNEDVDQLNNEIYNRLTEDVPTEKTYLSCDKVLDLDPNDDDAYDVTVLNSLNPPRLPPHVLKLKKNCIVMLLCNLNPAEGLCNGTRLIVTKLYDTCIRAKILGGSFEGDEVLISRSRMNVESTELSCKFQRIQLPLKLSFVMTINKGQGQSFDYTGVYFRKPPFAHGQLYVALSRARSKDKLIVQVVPGTHMGKLVPGSDDVYVPNIVYPEVLR